MGSSLSLPCPLLPASLCFGWLAAPSSLCLPGRAADAASDACDRFPPPTLCLPCARMALREQPTGDGRHVDTT